LAFACVLIVGIATAEPVVLTTVEEDVETGGK